MNCLHIHKRDGDTLPMSLQATSKRKMLAMSPSIGRACAWLLLWRPWTDIRPG